MRVVASFGMAAALLACGHAGARSTGAPSGLADFAFTIVSEPSTEPATISVEGWFRQNGEFQLYRDLASYGNFYELGACLSGAFLTDENTRARADTMQRSRVRITGTYSSADSLYDMPEGAISPINNYCGGEIIIYGRTIELLD